MNRIYHTNALSETTGYRSCGKQSSASTCYNNSDVGVCACTSDKCNGADMARPEGKFVKCHQCWGEDCREEAQCSVGQDACVKTSNSGEYKTLQLVEDICTYYN